MSERLDFSGRARRRARRARLSLGIWGISMLGTLVGIPTGTQLLQEVAAREGGGSANAAASTVVLTRWDPQDARARAQSARRASATVSTERLLRRRLRRERLQELRAERRRRRERREERRERREERRERRQELRQERRERRRERREERREAAEPDTIPEIIHAAAADYGIDGGYLMSVAWCESDLDPGAISPAGYYGLFQFDEPTWGEFGYGSIWDPIAQAQTAASMLAAGMYDRWPNCS